MPTSKKLLQLLGDLRERLSAKSNKERAIQMSAYMRNKFPYFGIQSPARRTIMREFIDANAWLEPEQLAEWIYVLWACEQREFQYIAMDYQAHYKRILPSDYLQCLEFQITNKSWWDTVDSVAKFSGYWFNDHARCRESVTRGWINSENMWLRRSALLFQLSYKKQTNEKLLYEFILQTAGEKEFFIRKAIGWTLREYGKTNPDSVIDFVSRTNLSTLSRREALKNI